MFLLLKPKVNHFINFVHKFEEITLDKNNENFIIEDNKILNNKLFAHGKDIIIILDFFHSDDNHGGDVSSAFLNYFKYFLKKDIDVHPILLSFNKNNMNIEHIDLIEYKEKTLKKYHNVLVKSYSFENYLKKIKDLNADSKIVLSLSIHKSTFKNNIILLSKKYDLKIAQAYLNNGIFDKNHSLTKNEFEKEYWPIILWFNFIMDKTNTLVTTNLKNKPLFWIKQISSNELNFNNNEERRKFNNIYKSTSFVTPILAYEYYLNKNSNLIK